MHNNKETTNLKKLWKETKEFIKTSEKRIANRYTSFLRDVARFYLEQGRRVFFRENTVVHYGEGGFGFMVIEGNDDINNILGEHILEIRFESKINNKIIEGYLEIKKENLDDIKYEN
ncbi:MAG: hypothetical protein Q7K21_03840 [Elusimicrobiota bacterium]|nr:hypothetical protein [Elusimicrobiota bacterium]